MTIAAAQVWKTRRLNYVSPCCYIFLTGRIILHVSGNSMSDITQVLSRIENGDQTATTELLPLVYDELRKLAGIRMQRELAGQTLQATALVHEAYLRILDSAPTQSWNSRGHFFGAAAEAMRPILVERARSKQSLKGGGQKMRQEFIDIAGPPELDTIDLIALDEALQKLTLKDPRKAELVKLRFFAGLTMRDAAEILGISTTTADNDWAYARCWLKLEMSQ